MDKKVLIITYYWPPAGGSGVQRWVKLAKYMLDYGYTPIILTVNPKYAAYPYIDHSLENDVAEGVQVYKTKSFNPISLGSRVVGKQFIPKAGFASGGRKGLVSQISLFLRTHLFIPDPRKGWNVFAYKKAKELINLYNPEAIITTGPPHSTHLIGLKLKKQFRIRWIVDFRDPWTDIYYYPLLNHTRISRFFDHRLEKKVFETADGFITVSKGLANLFKAKPFKSIALKPFSIIPNGFDPDDFMDVSSGIPTSDSFTITYLGTLAQQYVPNIFFEAIRELIDEGIPIKLRFIGMVANEVKQLIDQNSILAITSFEGVVEHNKVSEILAKSNALFLAIPQANHDKGILTGKIFEYLAAKRPIIGVGPAEGDAAEILRVCKAGVMFDRYDSESLKQYIRLLVNKVVFEPDENEIEAFSRKRQTSDLVQFLESFKKINIDEYD